MATAKAIAVDASVVNIVLIFVTIVAAKVVVISISLVRSQSLSQILSQILFQVTPSWQYCFIANGRKE